ncbi:DUF1501 domain-containing protein [Catenovulum sp. 2E275]|uniref:DUF1501 domain-containing protein n=1 Tax=Catenovulum sp. 2E275 TaxID=2980497 RepID=UPI0021D0CBF8|nr:DUF1501 domain-containing protein [Catenovulum sp. 2E275]MCU4677145.1 DUF1501 domain-containing protein [Catenovulum sp. 2E275]
MKRRNFLKTGCAAWVLSQQPYALAKVLEPVNAPNHKKLVWVVLRGAMDSLHAVVPVFDPYLNQHRASLVTPIAENLLPLERGFGLHPALKYLHNWYQQKQMMPVVAVASGYRQRSHFDAQDYLESGLPQIDQDNGWLGRAMQQKNQQGIAIARSVPVSMRGNQLSNTWFPSNLPDAEEDLYRALMQMYQPYPEFAERLNQGMMTRGSVEMDKAKTRNPKFELLAKNCGELLAHSVNTSCAMLEMGGWDTHNGQIWRLDKQFSQLDAGLNQLKLALAEKWRDTIVIVATEFGRTVKVNGTDGTDHGTASALFLAGGALNGGKVLGDWPGLAPENLYQNRDLKPTSAINSWLATVLHQHWQLNTQQVRAVFPDATIRSEQLLL